MSKLSLECTGTAVFPDGQIAVIGEFPPSDADASYAVVGGTGLYDNARGTLTIIRTTQAPRPIRELLYFRLAG